ncbi:MAG: SpoIIE family protein phosphatase [Melioribacteraceae bacterium]|nr:SpoIIE family protein phosphatase [Melioribacteraceae bacterium]
MIKRIFFLNLFIVCVLTAQQNYHFKKFSASEELSNTNVEDFFQDSYGFMWIATDDGLNRYDGNSIKIYKNKQGDAESLPDNDTDQIIEDLDKNLWVACFNAIGKLDRKTDKFKRYSLDYLQFKSQPTIYSAMLDDKGRVWFSLSELGIIRYDKETDKFVNIKLNEKNEVTSWGTVHSVTQLRNGVILAADAATGLKKYNHSTDEFEPFYLKPGYSPKGIVEIFEGSSGNIWFCGLGKLIKFSPTQYSVKEINLTDYSKVKTKYSNHTGIVEDFAGNLWVTVWTHGLFMVDKQLENIVQYNNNPANMNTVIANRNTSLYRDKYGIIWIPANGGITQIDPNSNQFKFDPIVASTKNSNQAIVSSITGSPEIKSKIIVGTDTEGLLAYDITSKKITKIELNDATIKSDSNNSINDFDIDYLGNIWFSINNSPLKKYDYKSKKILTFESPHLQKTATPLTIRSIDISHSNEVWVSSNQGVDIFYPKTNSFTSVPRIMDKKLSPELQNIITKIRNEKTPLSSILKVDEGENSKKKFLLEKKTNVVLVGLGEGRASMGMFDRGSLNDVSGKVIWKMSDIYETFYAGGGFKNRTAIKTLNLPKGEYQLNYYSDIGHLFGDWNVPAPADSNYWGIEVYQVSLDESKEIDLLLNQDLDNSSFLPFERAREVHFSNKFSNTIWIGTFTNSFFRYDLNTGKYKQYNFDKNNLTDASHNIRSIYEDIDGILWVGTYASLIRLDPQTDEYNIFTTDEGLPGGIISSIVEDNFGALWIYSSGGLSKLNKNAPIDEYVFVNYDNRDGIEGLTQSKAVWKNENGKLFFGGKGGVISFTPGNLNIVKPDVVVYDFKIDDISIYEDSLNFTITDGIYDTEFIELPYYQNDISFEFSSIHFSRPDKNKISYQLDGFNSKWYESDRNFASFTNLDPGKYVFRVKGSNGDGIWNEEGRAISIIINPPWWQTTFAYIFYGVIFLLIIFGVDRFQRRRLFAKAKERMKFQEVEHRVETAELQAKAAEAQAQVMEVENERKTKELEEARQLQLSMLPKELPKLPHLDIAVYMKTATEVGGDYYDFSTKEDGSINIAIGDATGHGLKAGILVSMMKSLFTANSNNKEIKEFFETSNGALKKSNLKRMMMGFAMLNIDGNKVTLMNAGMPPIYHYKNELKSLVEINVNGVPLGALKITNYEQREISVNKNDIIIMMSDGFPELKNDNGELLDYRRVEEEIKKVVNDIPEKIIEHLKNVGEDWVNGNTPDDDVTFVVIKVK